MKVEYKRIKHSFIINSCLFILIALVSGNIILTEIENYVRNQTREDVSLIMNVNSTLREHLNLKINELTAIADRISNQVTESGILDLELITGELKNEKFDELYLIEPGGDSLSLRGVRDNHFDQDYYRNGIRGDVYVSNSVIGHFDRNEAIIYVVPIYYHENVIGVLGGKSPLEEFDTFLSTNIYSERMNFYLVNHQGDLVAATGEVYPYLDKYIKVHPLLDSHKDSPHLVTNEIEKFELMNDNDEPRYITYQSVYSNSDWFLVSAPNEDYIGAIIKKAYQIIIPTFCLISLAIIMINLHITRIKKKNLMKIEKLAFNDHLTGLWNYNAFILQGSKRLKKKRDTEYLIVVFDFADFKLINEIYGYSKGDELLKEVANELRSRLKQNVLHTRLSNDVFGLLIEGYDFKNLDRLINDIKKINNIAGYKCFGKPINIHIGIYKCSSFENDFNRLLDYANLARVHAKTLQTQCYYVFDDQLLASTKEVMFIQKDIKQAIRNREFQVFYQSKFPPAGGKAVGAEALVRWIHPQNGFISPATFIPIAEKSGDIIDIGRYVFEEVCKLLKDRDDLGLKNIPISVNLSRVELYQLDLITFLKSMLTKYQINPRLIEIEITETTALNDIEVINEKIRLLHEMGMKVSMDDFGTGNSTFSNLKHANIDVLKIDRSFLWDIIENYKSREMVHGIINITKRIGVSVVCEGVESLEQVEILEQMGCDLIQGYVFSKPIPRTDFEKTIE